MNKISFQDGKKTFEKGLLFEPETIKELIRNCDYARSKFKQYRIIFPPVNESSLQKPFSYYFIPIFAVAKRTDTETFRNILEKDKSNRNFVVFKNLSKTSLLFSPKIIPGTDIITYRYISDFMEYATIKQITDIWTAVGHVALELSKKTTIFINTHGGGVAFLHIRIDGESIDHSKCHNK
jgi:hypothetical protein